MKGLRKTDAHLPETKKSKVNTELRIYDLSEKIVSSGWSRQDCFRYMQREWGLKDTQCQRYWRGALNYMTPEDPERYRELLVNRNYEILENMLRKALDSNNLKVANEIIRTMNQLLNVGGKKVEITDRDGAGEQRTFIISFGD